MEPLTSGQRVFYYDVLRTLSIFAVIFQHVCASDFFFFSFSSDWYFTTFGHSIVRWDVPMFVMISGALFLNPERDFPYRSLFGKYIPRLLIAYLFWKTAYYFIFDFRGSFSLDKFFLSHFHLWFLPMLMGIYMLVPILRKIVRDRTLEQYVLLLWLAVINVPSVRHLCSEMVTLPVISVVVFVLSLFTTKLIRCIPLLHKVVM